MTYWIKASLTRVRGVDGRPAGAGFLVGERLVLTCAHVVNLAAGRHPQADPPPHQVTVDFPLLPALVPIPPAPQPAAVLRWLPETAGGEGDVALLQLAADPPAGSAPATLLQADEPWGHRFRVCGFPAGYDDGDWASGRLLEAQATRWLQVEDDKPTGHWVQPGYSGAPVWDEELSGIVGMAVAADRHPDAKVAYVLPTAVLVEACPELAERSRLPCPYRGLAAFRQSDADIFFGRAAFTGRLLDAVWSRSLVALVGASGSGKSSVLFAGLLPALAREDDRVVAAFQPRLDPFHALAAALLPALNPAPALSSLDRLLETVKLADTLRQGRLDEVIGQVTAAQQGRPVLLVVDQFEKLFTLCPDADVRRGFLDTMLWAAGTSAVSRRRPLTVLLALRADFYGQALEHRALADALRDATILLGPMTRDELRQAVEEPARARGVIFEAGLVDRILDEVGYEAAHLPLLEATLTLLWEQQTTSRLTHRAYEELGGVGGALVRYAEGVVYDLEETYRIRRVFLQLVKPGEATAAPPRPANRTKLSSQDLALELPGNHRGHIQDAHSAVAEVAVDRSDLAGTPSGRSADNGALLRGDPLAKAERWLRQRPGDLSPAEQDFIHTSHVFQDRANRRLRVLVGGLAAMTILFAIVLIFAVLR